MLKNEYRIIGVMSGTSLDGIDLAYIELHNKSTWTFKIICAETIAYPLEWQQRLMNLVSFDIDDLRQIDVVYTEYLSEVISSFIHKNDIHDIDAVCSHGHTALHQPEKGLTYQIGNLPQMAQLLNQVVVCDFRVQDVKLGGQGAPLVPIGDELLFSEYDYCLNLGGFANISQNIDKVRVAYDICPVNIVLNDLTRSLGKSFDPSGTIAKTGSINLNMLEMLNNLDYYEQAIPKSLGLEWVRDNIFSILGSSKDPANTKLRTFVEHIADQISKSIIGPATILATGGGVYNSFLMERISDKCSAQITIPDSKIVEFKEALIFGLLGVLRLRNEPNVLASVTGAKKDHSSGEVYYP